MKVGRSMLLVVGYAILFSSGNFAARSQQTRLATTDASSNTHQATGSTAINEGRSLFNQTCAHCHGPDASTGLPERNLRHLRLRYGADMHNLFETTVKNGRPEKGMPVWGEVLDADTIEKIYGYLETIQEDTN